MAGHLEDPEDTSEPDHSDEHERLEVLVLGNHQTYVKREDCSEIDPVNDGFPELLFVGAAGESRYQFDGKPNDADHFYAEKHFLVPVLVGTEKIIGEILKLLNAMLSQFRMTLSTYTRSELNVTF